jgi:hypothetical protein
MLNNIADISKFETIQREAHQSMGFSSLSVFNATFKVIDEKKAEANKRNIDNWTNKFIAAEKFLTQTTSEVEQKQKEFEKKEAAFKKKEGAGYYKEHKKEMDATFQEYRKADSALAEIKDKRTDNFSNMNYAIKEFKKWGVVATTDVDLDGI